MKEYKAVIYSTEHGKKYRYFDSLLAAKRWCTKLGPAFDMDGAQIFQAPPFELRDRINGYYDIVTEKIHFGRDSKWK